MSTLTDSDGMIDNTTAGTGRPEASQLDTHGPSFVINIEGRLYSWHSATITPPQIRALGDLPADQPVIEIDFADNTEHTLTEDTVVAVKPGHGFGKKIEFKRGSW